MQILTNINFNPISKFKPDLRTRKDQGKCSAAGATQNRLD